MCKVRNRYENKYCVTTSQQSAVQLEYFFAESGFYVPWVHFGIKGHALIELALLLPSGTLPSSSSLLLTSSHLQDCSPSLHWLFSNSGAMAN